MVESYISTVLRAFIQFELNYHLRKTYEILLKFINLLQNNLYFVSNSIETNSNENDSTLLRPIYRHYAPVKSNRSRQAKQIVSPPKENIPDQSLSNHHRKIKQFHHEFIQRWTNDARNIYAQSHLIHSPSTYSYQMTNVDLEKTNRSRPKLTSVRRHRSLSSSSHFNNSYTSSSSLLNELHNHKTKTKSFNSLSSTLNKQLNNKHKNTSSNNSALVNHESKNVHDNIECKLS
ncbi:unnamed protein product [Rotaria magnacalcarata]|uniref:Uncharacterized protein n=1 Tax=Rotaria magnacalcarata TaxID=392030 RepID=A0A820UIR6_9BILA|nr:unnamed protein product [Rotaria magnacalcarata]